ncbi:superoxide dismutase [Bdellovibrionota bacterium FG-1]
MPTPFMLPKFPYGTDAFAPVISARTIDFHYGKHHQGYINNLNKLVSDSAFAQMSLEEVVIQSRKKEGAGAIFNNAAQSWNHAFYWNSLSPKSQGIPSAKILGLIEKTWGSYDEFKAKFSAAAAGQFGSGWAWLIAKGGVLEITTTSNAETPLGTGATPLLTLDVWEHAYYLDFQNRRADYLNALIDRFLNWEFVEKNLTNPG